LSRPDSDYLTSKTGANGEPRRSRSRVADSPEGLYERRRRQCRAAGAQKPSLRDDVITRRYDYQYSAARYEKRRSLGRLRDATASWQPELTPTLSSSAVFSGEMSAFMPMCGRLDRSPRRWRNMSLTPPAPSLSPALRHLKPQIPRPPRRHAFDPLPAALRHPNTPAFPSPSRRTPRKRPLKRPMCFHRRPGVDLPPHSIVDTSVSPALAAPPPAMASYDKRTASPHRTPNAGFAFVNGRKWRPVSGSATYLFTPPSTSLTANFAPAPRLSLRRPTHCAAALFGNQLHRFLSPSSTTI